MPNSLSYKVGAIPDTAAIIRLYRSAGLQRPIQDAARITTMYAHANLVISAWDGPRLVGISRSLTDFAYCCYLADLAVAESHQRRGIGRQLIALTQEQIGEQCMLLLLAAPGAMPYYPKLGFDVVSNGFIRPRKR